MVDFPSGSKWGIEQLSHLAFPLEPEVHELDELQCGLHISDESAKVLDKLRLFFGTDASEWKNGDFPKEYKGFYKLLSAMQPRIKGRPSPTEYPTTRSNTTLQSSSLPSSSLPSSPLPVRGVKRPAPLSTDSSPSKGVSPPGNPHNVVRDVKQSVPLSTDSTPSKGVSSPGNPHTAVRDVKRPAPSSIVCTPTKDVLPPGSPRTITSGPGKDNTVADVTPSPTAKRGLSFTKSPSLPTRTLTPPRQTIHDEHLGSSQTDPTFQENSDSESESEESQGDRAELKVTSTIRELLERICDEHGDCNGYQLSVDSEADTLRIPICGDFPKTTPDLIVRVRRGVETFQIVDCEV